MRDEPFAAQSPTAFISYTHDSRAYKAQVLSLADHLRERGVECRLDQYEMNPHEGWPRWTLNMVEASTFVLVVCSERYDRKFRGLESGGAQWEGAVITQALYDQNGQNSKFIPIGFQPRAANPHIPSILRAWTYYDVSTASGFDDLYRYLTAQPATVPAAVGPIRPMPPAPPSLRTLDLTRDRPHLDSLTPPLRKGTTNNGRSR